MTGTQLPGSVQFTIASHLASTLGFTMAADPPPADLVVAFEYFEHFEQPVAHLHDVLDATSCSALWVANTFTQPAAGHFREYVVGGKPVAGTQMARQFNSALRACGYRKVDANLWNARPTYWVAA